MTKTDAVAWILGMALVALVLLSPAACTMHRQYLVERAIKGGADPIAAKCAIEAEMSQSPVCIVKALAK